MALEIERRFLVAGDGWREHVRWSRNLQQGYLAGSADGLTLRVRSDGAGAAWLTLKYPARGIARQLLSVERVEPLPIKLITH